MVHRKSISILGSTGSIGVQALQVVSCDMAMHKVVHLSAGSNYSLLAKQINAFNPYSARISNNVEKLIECLDDDSALHRALPERVDTTVAATSGISGLRETMDSVHRSGRVAIANKESLVCAGNEIGREAKRFNTEIVPIDSENTSLFVLLSRDADRVESITLTASGGPFFGESVDAMRISDRAQVLNHPKWKMGSKVTVDSATMMNKVFEVIIAKNLFKIPKIDILIHPECIVHAIVNYRDGNSICLMSDADMRIPISCALYYPEKLWNGKRLNLKEIRNLSFYEPDVDKFPSLRFLDRILSTEIVDPALCTMMNIANEIAVARFLRNEIKFIEIVGFVELLMSRYYNREVSSMHDILDLHEEILMSFDRQCQ